MLDVRGPMGNGIRVVSRRYEFDSVEKDGGMAGKPQNRRELRRQYDAAEPLDPMEEEAEDLVEDVEDDDAGERKPKKKAKAPAKPKVKAVKPAKAAARMRIVWVAVSYTHLTLPTNREV